MLEIKVKIKCILFSGIYFHLDLLLFFLIDVFRKGADYSRQSFEL